MGAFNQILIQTGYYAFVLILGVGFIAMLQRGFFWKYIKVKTSFGKYVMIKLRTSLRDYFAVGRMEDGFLIFKKNKLEVRVSIDRDHNFFYRTLGVNWIDYDEEKGAVCKVDYTGISGHDVEKENSLYVRSLTRPSVADNQQRIILIVVCVAAILGLAAAFLSYSNYAMLKEITLQLPNLVKNTVTGSTGLI